MIPYTVYKLVHFSGIFVLLITLAVSALHVVRGGDRKDNPNRRLIGAMHGVASFFILLGGFGMLARLGIVQSGLPGWILFKLGIWLVLSAALWLVYRGAGYARLLFVAVPVLAVLAAAVAMYKPF